MRGDALARRLLVVHSGSCARVAAECRSCLEAAARLTHDPRSCPRFR
jgi:hypothetical protein